MLSGELAATPARQGMLFLMMIILFFRLTLLGFCFSLSVSRFLLASFLFVCLMLSDLDWKLSVQMPCDSAEVLAAYQASLHRATGDFPWRPREKFRTLPPLELLSKPPKADEPWDDNPK